MNSRLLNLWALCLLSLTAIANNSPTNEPASKSLFDVLQKQEVQHVTLSMDMEALSANRNTDVEIPANFSFMNADGFPDQLSVKVRTRGRFRRRICNDMPPLKLNFKKGELKDKGLQKFDSYKLVTHCLDNEEAKANVLKEFLAYQIYEKLSPYSYRTQLVQIEYVDVNTGESTQQLGFFIEDTDELEKRLNATQIKDEYGMTLNDLDENSTMVQTMFQYLISNTDWNIASFRNVKIMQLADKEKPVVVPYDFDFSGLVNAAYARPNVDKGQKSITQRVFMGEEMQNVSWDKMKRYFKMKKDEILQVVDDTPEMSKRTKAEAKKYIESFYYSLRSIG